MVEADFLGKEERYHHDTHMYLMYKNLNDKGIEYEPKF